jgi:VanZ family protein
LNNPSSHGVHDRDFALILWWLITLGWATLIFYLSTATFATWFSAWLLHQLLDLLRVNISAAAFAALHFLVRKFAHLTEYAMFSLLLYGALSGGRQFAWRARTAWQSVVIAALYSLIDELHQSFVPGRTASWTDCGIDAAGAALGMLFLYASEWCVQAKASRRAARKDSPADI